MKTLFLLNVLALGVMVATFTGRTAFLVDDAEIAKKICPNVSCLDHWNNPTTVMCDDPYKTKEPTGKHYVYGSFAIGQTTCLCPCNFSKFYK